MQCARKKENKNKECVCVKKKQSVPIRRSIIIEHIDLRHICDICLHIPHTHTLVLVTCANVCMADSLRP